MEELEQAPGEVTESAEALAERQFEAMQVFGAKLGKIASEQVTKRKPIERRWLEDLRQYYGQYDPEVEQDLRDTKSSRLFLNITRPKTNTFSSRMQDMLLPTDEVNWGVEHSPLPDVGDMVKSEKPVAPAQPGPQFGPSGEALSPVAGVQERDVAEAAVEAARDAAEKMELQIADQLVECQYNAVQRRVIEQMAQLGTGVCEGPIQVERKKFQWQEVTGEDGSSEWQRKVVGTEVVPIVEFVDIWDFFPEMSSPEPSAWSFGLRRYYMTSKELRERTRSQGFNEKAVRWILREGSSRSFVEDDHLAQLRAIQGLTNYVDDRYVIWKYVGPIDKEDLRSCGCDVDDDELAEYFGTVWFSDNVVLKVDPYFLDSNQLPWSVCYYEKDAMSPFGWGVPRVMRGEQKGAAASWRMLFDNAGLSTGPQTVIDAGAIKGADGNYQLRPRKTWLKDPALRNVPIGNLIESFSIDAHQEELLNLLNTAIRMADDVTSTPLIVQGDQASHITKTAQGMALLNNNANVVLKRPAKFYDDYFSAPLIGRMIEWNMQFSKNNDVKGDLRPVARGSTVLLERDQQAQLLMQFMQYKGSVWDPYFDWYEVARTVSKNMRVMEVLLDEGDVEENIKKMQDAAAAQAQQGQQGGGDPRMEIEGLRLQDSREQRALDKYLSEVEYAMKRGISMEQASKELAVTRMKIDSESRKFNAEVALKLRKGEGI
jgi:hypothetical protein